MVDLASPEARERIAFRMFKAHNPGKTKRDWRALSRFVGGSFYACADAALAEVAAMLKEDGDAH